jgi:hypothetical protein
MLAVQSLTSTYVPCKSTASYYFKVLEYIIKYFPQNKPKSIFLRLLDSGSLT